MQAKKHKTLHAVIAVVSSWVFWLLFAGTLGFFVYGFTLVGFMGGMLIAFIVSIVSVVGFIPVLGPFLYWLWFGPSAINWGLGLAGLQATWLTYYMQLVGLILAIFLTAIATFFSFMIFMPRRRM